MSLDKAMKNLKFDKRLIEWHVNNNQLSQDELNAHLATLPDVAHNIAMNVPEDDQFEKKQEQH
ncbi:MAG: hypothetical protein EOP04_32810 [Proteobacteria bacterium]|nr:MAG: hypothetical protein EOP04_32810 [Pseudomonadota bacterium]